MITILCGKSASGKDTLLQELIKKGYTPIISTTTRPMREGEKEGREYFFVDNDKFNALIKEDKLVEYRKYNALNNGKEDVWYYGTQKQDFNKNKNYIVILDLEGAASFKKAFPLLCQAVYIDTAGDIRTSRAKERGSFDEGEWNRRFISDEAKFSPENVDKVCDYIIHNNGTSKALLNEFLGIKDIPTWEQIRDKTVWGVKYDNGFRQTGDYDTISSIARLNEDVEDYYPVYWKGQPKEVQAFHKAYSYALYTLKRNDLYVLPDFYKAWAKNPAAFEPPMRPVIGDLLKTLNKFNENADIIIENFDGENAGNHHVGVFKEALQELGCNFDVVDVYRRDTSNPHDYHKIVVQNTNFNKFDRFGVLANDLALKHDRYLGDGKYWSRTDESPDRADEMEPEL